MQKRAFISSFFVNHVLVMDAGDDRTIDRRVLSVDAKAGPYPSRAQDVGHLCSFLFAHGPARQMRAIQTESKGWVEPKKRKRSEKKEEGSHQLMEIDTIITDITLYFTRQTDKNTRIKTFQAILFQSIARDVCIQI